jgi:AraC-like DNA-binding protein
MEAKTELELSLIRTAMYYDGLVAGFENRVTPREPLAVFDASKVIQQTQRVWEYHTLLMSEIKPRPSFEVAMAGGDLRLSVVVDSVGGTMFSTVGSDAEEIVASGPSISVATRDAPSSITGTGVTYLRHLVVDVDVESAAEDLELAAPFEQLFRSTPQVRDQRLDIALRRLSNEDVLADELVGHDALNNVLKLLIGELAIVRPAQRGGLAPWQLRRIRDYVDAHITGPMRLRALANVAGLSTSHFTRAFRESVGFTPHHWITLQRCTLAKEMLIRNELSLADIAFEVGFADQAHFSRSFKQLVGAGPGAWRRERVG